MDLPSKEKFHYILSHYGGVFSIVLGLRKSSLHEQSWIVNRVILIAFIVKISTIFMYIQYERFEITLIA